MLGLRNVHHSYGEIVWCEGTNLDLFPIEDKSLEYLDDLEVPGVIAEEIADDLEAALEQFEAIATDLGEREEA